MAKLLIDIEQIKEHPELRVETLFDIPKEEEEERSIDYEITQTRSLLQRRKSDEDVEEQVPEVVKREHRD